MVRLVFRRRKTAEEIAREAGCNIDSTKIKVSYVNNDIILLEIESDNEAEIAKLKKYFIAQGYTADKELLSFLEKKLAKRGELI